jgi:hypothetical protein
VTRALTVSGTIVTGRRRTSLKLARTFRFTWSGLAEDRKVVSAVPAVVADVPSCRWNGEVSYGPQDCPSP